MDAGSPVVPTVATPSGAVPLVRRADMDLKANVSRVDAKVAVLNENVSPVLQEDAASIGSASLARPIIDGLSANASDVVRKDAGSTGSDLPVRHDVTALTENASLVRPIIGEMNADMNAIVMPVVPKDADMIAIDLPALRNIMALTAIVSQVRPITRHSTVPMIDASPTIVSTTRVTDVARMTKGSATDGLMVRDLAIVSGAVRLPATAKKVIVVCGQTVHPAAMAHREMATKSVV